MTYTRFGLTSRTLREAVAHGIFARHGYDCSRLLADAELGPLLQVSLSAKAWTVYLGGRESGVSLRHDDAATAGSRGELVGEVVRSAFPHWRDAVGDTMRTRALHAAGLTEYDAAPAWSLLIHPVVAAVGAVTGLPAKRLCLMSSSGTGLPSFADLDQEEALASTDHYLRHPGCARDYLKASEGERPWWRIGHTFQLLADDDFPIRSIVVRPGRTTIEMRHAIPETQMLGLVGVPLSKFIDMDGLEAGTVGGDLPILDLEHSDMWNRVTLTVDTVHVPGGRAPAGTDMRWAGAFATRTPSESA